MRKARITSGTVNRMNKRGIVYHYHREKVRHCHKPKVKAYRLSVVVQQEVAIFQPEQLLHLRRIYASTSSKVIQNGKDLALGTYSRLDCGFAPALANLLA